MVACIHIEDIFFLAAAVSDATTGRQLNVRHEQSVLEASLKELERARSKSKSHWLNQSHDLARREERASLLATIGGSPGMYEFERTGQLLPILVGTTMPDPAGTGLEVPILGAEADKATGNLRPLGGSMEDPEGQGEPPLPTVCHIHEVQLYLPACYSLLSLLQVWFQ